MKAFFKLIFGGSFGYVQGGIIIAAAAFVGYHWIKYHDLQDDNAKLKTEVFWSELQSNWRANQITAIGEIQEQTAKSNKQQAKIEGHINAQPKTNDCAKSLAIGASIDGVRERRERAKAAADKRLSIQLPNRRAQSPD